SIPIPVTIGKNKGVSINTAALESIIIPTNNKIILINNIITIGEACNPNTVWATTCGTCLKVKYQLNTAELAITNIIIADVTTDFFAILNISLNLISL